MTVEWLYPAAHNNGGCSFTGLVLAAISVAVLFGAIWWDQRRKR